MNCTSCKKNGEEQGVKMLRCTACYGEHKIIVPYCSAECQRKHWKEHKPNCGKRRRMPTKSATASGKQTGSNVKQVNGISALSSFWRGERFEAVANVRAPNEFVSNWLILFHGEGGRLSDMATFAKQFPLPQTAALCIQAPLAVLDLGFEWARSFDARGDLRRDDDPILLSHMDGAANDLVELLLRAEEDRKSFGAPLSNFYILGFSQGAALAIQVAFRLAKRDIRLGGVVAVSDCMPGALKLPEGVNLKSPICVLHGELDDRAPVQKARDFVQLLRNRCDDVELHTYAHKKHRMIDCKEEAMDVAKWFSPLLITRSPTLENDAIIISGPGQNASITQIE